MSLSNENKPITPQPELPIDSPEFSIALIMYIQWNVCIELRAKYSGIYSNWALGTIGMWCWILQLVKQEATSP